MSTGLWRTKNLQVSLPLHLAEEKQNGGDQRYDGVAKHPREVGEDIRVVPCQYGTLHIHGVNEGEGVGDVAEGTADQLKVKPRAREPG